MVQSSELKTSLKTRIAIIVIAVMLLGSTVALYMGIVMSYGNGGTSTVAQSEKEERLQELFNEYQERLAAQAAELSTKYFDTFKPQLERVRAFNAADITAIATKDLVVGTGAEMTEGDTNYMAYYLGWLADETIFDSSFDSTDSPTALKTPLAGGNLIEGWNQGILGMKIGGIREISIPAELAYGGEENGSIPANSPLKFVVMLIDPVEQIDWPEEMYELYGELYGNAE